MDIVITDFYESTKNHPQYNTYYKIYNYEYFIINWGKLYSNYDGDILQNQKVYVDPSANCGKKVSDAYLKTLNCTIVPTRGEADIIIGFVHTYTSKIPHSLRSEEEFENIKPFIINALKCRDHRNFKYKLLLHQGILGAAGFSYDNVESVHELLDTGDEVNVSIAVKAILGIDWSGKLNILQFLLYYHHGIFFTSRLSSIKHWSTLVTGLGLSWKNRRVDSYSVYNNLSTLNQNDLEFVNKLIKKGKHD